MRGKLTLLIGFGAGYVLGARAGRERYDQIADRVKAVAGDPKVQEKARRARDVAAEKTEQAAGVAMHKAAQATDAAKEKASDAAHAAKDKVSGSDEPTTGLGAGMPGPDPRATADVNALGDGPVTGDDLTR